MSGAPGFPIIVMVDFVDGLASPEVVFVTPRTWPTDKLQDWLKKKKDLGDWKDVRVIDGVALEDWLERNPAVAARLAVNF